MKKALTLFLVSTILTACTTATAPTEEDQTTEDQSIESTDTEDSSVDNTATTDETSDTEDNGTEDNGSIAAQFTMSEVQQHSDASSCWSTINGSVYDLTSWISQHPGGERNILKLCGTDGSSAFQGQHGNNTEAKNELAGFFIGTLKK